MSGKTAGRAYYILILLAWAAYLFIYLNSPSPAAERYDLSGLELALIKLTVAVPLLIIWLTATHGFVYLRRYIKLIKDSPDGRAFARLSAGIGTLVVGIVTTAITGQLLYYAHRTGWAEQAVVLHNYLQILFPFLAFATTYWGSRRLLDVAGAKDQVARHKWSIFWVFLPLAPLYTWMVFNDPDRLSPTSPGVVLASHYLTDPLILVTIVMPYLITWAFGGATMLNLWLFGRVVKGNIYRGAVKYLLRGIGGVVAFSIVLQLLATSSGALGRLGLKGILGLVYLILIAYALGYVYIALGAKKLTQIEEAQ